MNLTEMTYIELFKLYHQVGVEMTVRSWWLIPLILVPYIIYVFKFKGKKNTLRKTHKYDKYGSRQF